MYKFQLLGGRVERGWRPCMADVSSAYQNDTALNHSGSLGFVFGVSNPSSYLIQRLYFQGKLLLQEYMCTPVGVHNLCRVITLRPSCAQELSQLGEWRKVRMPRRSKRDPPHFQVAVPGAYVGTSRPVPASPRISRATEI